MTAANLSSYGPARVALVAEDGPASAGPIGGKRMYVGVGFLIFVLVVLVIIGLLRRV